MYKRCIRRIVSVAITFLMVLSVMPMNLRAEEATPTDVRIIIKDSSKPMKTEYIGSNTAARKSFTDGNITKFLGDSMIDIARIFQEFEFTKDTDYGDGVIDEATFQSAKQAVIANPENNRYINWEVLEKGIMDIVPGASVLELKKLGIESLIVLRPLNKYMAKSANRSYESSWEWWEKCFALSYHLAKNYGVINYNLTNEADWFTFRGNRAEHVEIIKMGAEAVRAGVKTAIGKEAIIWGPTFITNNSDLQNYVLDNADEAIDVYDWHMYKPNPKAYKERIIETRQRVKDHNTDGIEEKLSLSEYNYSLAKNIEVADNDKMKKVLTNMKIQKQQIDNGLYAPIHFKMVRGNRRSKRGTGDTVYTTALIRVDGSTQQLREPTKMYYGFRMINRMVKNADKRLDYELSGDNEGMSIMATSNKDNYYVLAMNSSSTKEHYYSLDLSELGITASTVSVRAVSSGDSDEEIGTYPIIDGIVTVENIPIESAIQFIIPKNDKKPNKPNIHKAFSEENSIEIWWNNLDNSSHYVVQRKTKDGEWEDISKCNESFYEDKVLDNQEYYYRVVAVNINGRSVPSDIVGPLQRTNEPFSLPFRCDFEDKSKQGWTEIGNWEITEDLYSRFEENFYKATSPGRNIATIGSTKWTDYSMSFLFNVQSVNKGFGLIARYQDENNYYVVEYDKATSSMLVKRIRDGQETILKRANIDAEQISSIKRCRALLYVYDNKLELSIDNVRVIGCTDDDPLTSGKVGFLSDDADIYFGGIRVFPCFVDDFQDNDAKNWSNLSGNWEITGEGDFWYTQTNGETEDISLAVNGCNKTEDYIMTAKVKLDDFLAQEARAMLVTRYIDENNYYWLGIENEKLTLNKKVNGKDVVIQAKEFDFQNGEEYRVRINLFKNTHSVYINSNLYIDAVDYEPALKTGKIGIGTYKAKVSFDEVIVNKLFMESTPVIDNIEQTGEGTVKVYFSPVDGADSYNIMYGLDYEGHYNKKIVDIPASQNPYTITGLTEGINYIFTMSSNNSSGESNISSSKEIVIADELYTDSNEYDLQDTQEVFDVLNQNNYSIETKVTPITITPPTGTTPSGVIGLVLRMQDDEDGYYALIEENRLLIKEVIDGETKVLVQKPYEVVPGEPYTVKTAINENAISMYVNGRKELVTTTKMLSNGKVALYTDRSRATFSDILVKPINTNNIIVENFEDQKADDFRLESGDWKIDKKNGSYSYVTNGGVAIAETETLDNHYIEANILSDNLTVGSVAVGMRIDQEGNGYFIKVSDKMIQIVKKSGNQEEILIEERYNLAPSEAFTLKGKVVGNKIYGYINGLPKLSTTDETYSSGQTCLEASKGITVYFDDVTIGKIPFDIFPQ